MWFGRRHVSCQSILLLTVAVACSTAQELSYAPNRSPTILFTHNGDGLQPLSDLDIYSDVPRTNRYAYPELDQNDLGFLTPENDEYIQGEMNYGRPNSYEYEYAPRDYMGHTRNKSYKKIILDMLDDNDIDAPSDGMKKRVLSSFRERMETEKTKNQREQLAEQFLKKLEDEQEAEREAEIEYDANREYIEELRELWNKYKHSRPLQSSEYEPRVFPSDVIRKRQFQTEYPSLGWSGVGYRKRESPANYEIANEALYHPFDEDDRKRARRVDWRNEPMGYEILDDSEPNYLRNQDLVYVKRKRNAVTKRSSNYYNNHHKRFANKEQYKKKAFAKKDHQGTDPKVLKDLRNIFGTKENNKTDKVDKKQDVKKQEAKKAIKKQDEATTAAATTRKHEDDKKKRSEEAELVVSDKFNNERINIKKKSVDWSNYFGYDRRKKSSRQNEINEEWLMDRYRKSVTDAKKREYPLKFFRNHDETKRDSEEADEEKNELINQNDSKLGEMDGRLKYIEDLIIDEALKYTGAHEGATDKKEIQEVKDNVISRLAAAYSLEKMRRALSEFKTSIAAQRYALKYNDDGDNKLDDVDEKKRDDKRVVKKKNYGTDEEKRNSKNDLDELDEYQMDQSSPASAGFEIIERRCRSILPGNRNDNTFQLCKWHQICYICAPDSQEAYENCDTIFINRAYDGCGNDLVCQWSVRPQLELLRDSVRSMNPDHFDKSICNAEPPNARPMFE